MTVTPLDSDAAGLLPLATPRRTPVDVAAFRGAMSSLAATVCVVTAAEADRRVGRTATAVFSLSSDPPSILVSLDTHAEIVGMIRRRGSFSMAMLATDQSAIADAFAGALPPDLRFDNGRWRDWPSGNPKLDGPVVVMDCDVVGTMEVGAHTLYAGALVAVETAANRAPLLWHRHRYATLAGPQS